MKESPMFFFNPTVSKEQILKKLGSLNEDFVTPIRHELEHLLGHEGTITRQHLEQLIREVRQVEEIITPIHSLYLTEQLILHKRVMLAETHRRHQSIAKMALGGSGVELDIVTSLEEGKQLLRERNYDVLCANAELLRLIPYARRHYPEIKSVFMTSQPAQCYYPVLQQFPSISNIVTRHEEDRTYYLKNILTTVSKLITGDVFGIDKYLDWGADIRVSSVTHSDQRDDLIDEMGGFLRRLGVRKIFKIRAEMVAEEFLMNAIYDAPVNEDGTARYNHLPRTSPVQLIPEERAVFRYACDGFLLAVAVEDPFGSFSKEIALNYLESCYTGRAGSLNQNKGGAGLGLYQVMQMCDLFAINVAPGERTEMVAIFNIDPNYTKTTSSFHYFNRD